MHLHNVFSDIGCIIRRHHILVLYRNVLQIRPVVEIQYCLRQSQATDGLEKLRARGVSERLDGKVILMLKITDFRLSVAIPDGRCSLS
jgi:hypothetical protein